MSPELMLLSLTAVLAVIAVVAALVAVRASRRTQAPEPRRTPPPEKAAPAAPAPTDGIAPREPELQPVVQVIEGRVIVTPTTRQVVDATMNRPLVRISVISHGLAHALRPESRDKIVALMRREFQSRRRQRRRAARQAARVEHPAPAPAIDRATVVTEAWLGELPPVRHQAIES